MSVEETRQGVLAAKEQAEGAVGMMQSAADQMEAVASAAAGAVAQVQEARNLLGQAMDTSNRPEPGEIQGHWAEAQTKLEEVISMCEGVRTELSTAQGKTQAGAEAAEQLAESL